MVTIRTSHLREQAIRAARFFSGLRRLFFILLPQASHYSKDPPFTFYLSMKKKCAGGCTGAILLRPTDGSLIPRGDDFIGWEN